MQNVEIKIEKKKLVIEIELLQEEGEVGGAGCGQMFPRVRPKGSNALEDKHLLGLPF
jgi:hypothetical protein